MFFFHEHNNAFNETMSFLYPYNWSNLLQYSKYNNIAKGVAQFQDKTVYDQKVKTQNN